LDCRQKIASFEEGDDGGCLGEGEEDEEEHKSKRNPVL
jgi:hypothetical protein